MSIIAKIIGIRPQTNAKNDSIFWNIGFRMEEPISVVTGIGDDGKPVYESVNTFSMASDQEFPEETLGRWYAIDGLSLRVAVNESGQVVRHASGEPCLNADRGRRVKFTRLEEQGIIFE